MTLPRSDSVWALYALTNSMMLTPCWPSAGPTGGAGVAAPAWICSLMRAATFFLGGMSFLVLDVLDVLDGDVRTAGSRRRLELGDLAEGQLDRRLAAEDGHQDLELLAVDADLGDGRRQGLERAFHDGDRLADLEVHDLDVGGLRPVLRLEGRREHREDLVQAQRHRLVGVTDETGHARRVPDGAPRLVGEVHPDQHVAGHPHPAHLLALAVLDLGHLFH